MKHCLSLPFLLSTPFQGSQHTGPPVVMPSPISSLNASSAWVRQGVCEGQDGRQDRRLHSGCGSGWCDLSLLPGPSCPAQGHGLVWIHHVLPAPTSTCSGLVTVLSEGGWLCRWVRARPLAVVGPLLLTSSGSRPGVAGPPWPVTDPRPAPQGSSLVCLRQPSSRGAARPHPHCCELAPSSNSGVLITPQWG